MTHKPLNERPSLRVTHCSGISEALSRLGRENGLIGAVVVTFTRDRYGTASWCIADIGLPIMENLADRILEMLDDGRLDPEGLPK